MNTNMTVKVELSRQERDAAKRHAKSQGMTFQAWLGRLVKRELKKAGAADGTSIG